MLLYKFSTTKECVDETSTVQLNKILGLEFAFFVTYAPFSLIKTLFLRFKSLMLSFNWTPFFKDQEITPIVYQTCITWQVFYSL